MSAAHDHNDDDESTQLLPDHMSKYDKLPRSARAWRLLAGCQLLCILALIATSAIYASLYYGSVSMARRQLPPWPEPSHSLLGEYRELAVAADNVICSEIGRTVIAENEGNAVDGAIATLFCIGIMDTQSAGLGGGHFMTIYNASTQMCHVIDAREVAPIAATEKMYVDRWKESQTGWRAVAVPGELHGMWTAFTRYGSGRVQWRDLVMPTIRLMQNGYITSSGLAHALKSLEPEIRAEPSMAVFINPRTGRVYEQGEAIKTRRAFVDFLQKIADAEDPVQLFYDSNYTEQMATEFASNGGILTIDDFKQYRSIVRGDDEVIITKLLDGRRICGPPPPSGSAVTQSILGILDGYIFNGSKFDDVVELYHRYLEASKFAFASRSRLGDMNFVNGSHALAKNITTSWYGEQIRAKIGYMAKDDAFYGGSFDGTVEDHGTTHISVLDMDGNAVAVTSTINLLMGARVVSPSTGILWNDEMDDFSTPGHPNFFGFPPSPSNYIVPGKRPQSSMSPLVVFDHKQRKAVLAIGGAGGSTIISGVAGVALQALWTGKDLKQAMDLPRLHNQLQPNVTEYEANFPEEYLDALRRRGQKLHQREGHLTVITAIHRSPNGTIYANSDFRKGTESGPAGY